MKPLVTFVIDSNPIHRSLIKYHLNVNKFETVHAFQSVDECYYRLKHNMIPDIIVADYDPVHHLDATFVQKICQISSSIKVFFFSSSNDPILAINLLESGAVDYIIKTSRLDYGIHELIKNIKYLIRENAHT